MRPLYHPPVSEITVEGILYALADPARVAILAQLANSDCEQNCAAFAKLAGKNLPKSTLSQHFKILRESGLIRSERVGVEMRNTTRYHEFKGKFTPMIDAILKAYTTQKRQKA